MSREGPPAGPALCMGVGMQEIVTAEVGGSLGPGLVGRGLLSLGLANGKQGLLVRRTLEARQALCQPGTGEQRP